jgi:hypothetical protein
MLRRAPSNPPGLNLAAEGCRMEITRRNFRHSIDRRLAGWPLGLSWTQAKDKHGYMKIVDNAD